MFLIAVKALKDWRELTDDVGQRQELLVQLVAAGFAEPHKGIEFIGQVALTLNHQSHSVGWTLRGMGRARWEEEDFSLLDMDIAGLSIVDNLHDDVALDLVEELLALIIVVVLAVVWSTHDHNDEFRVLIHLGIADRGLEQVAVFIDPGMKIEGALDRHAKLTQTIGWYIRSHKST